VDETRENECVKTHAESRRCLAKASHSALVEGEASRHLPSGNVFWIFTVAGAVSVADLEDRADGATVLASCSLEADVVFAAVVGMGVAGERSRVAHFSGGGTGEASGDFCKGTSERHSLSNWDSKNYLRSCILGLDRPTCRREPRGRRPVRGALVPGGFTVPTVPEDVAFALVGEDAVQALAVSGGDRWLCNGHVKLPTSRLTGDLPSCVLSPQSTLWM
jgi:hypothetical protein